MKKKNILVFFPHNFLELRSGCHRRMYELMRYFRLRGFTADVWSLEHFENSWDGQDLGKEGLIRRLYLYDFAIGSRLKPAHTPLASLKNLLFRGRQMAAGREDAVRELYDFAFEGMKKQFAKILKDGDYDFIVIGYAYWAGLLESLPGGDITTVLDMSDFLTLNLFDAKGGKDVAIGPLLEEEIRRVNMFDKVMCISDDERYFFSRFAKRPSYSYIPISLPAQREPRRGPFRHDIVFVGSDNPHNQEGIRWFFDSVYPELRRNARMVIVGDITSYVQSRERVELIKHVADLDELYRSSRVAVCPLLGGTGMKIKVVEALSYGMPVVSTSHGVVGFTSKSDNGCTVADNPGDFARHINRLLDDTEFYERQSSRGLAFFLDNFEESRVFSRLDEVFMIKDPGGAVAHRG